MRLTLAALVTVFLFSAGAARAADEPEKAGAIVKGKDEDTVTSIMKSIAKAMGKKCNFCHVRKEGKFQFKTWTKRKKVALWMYTEFVQKLKKADGGEVTCGTCHKGSPKVIGKALE